MIHYTTDAPRWAAAAGKAWRYHLDDGTPKPGVSEVMEIACYDDELPPGARIAADTWGTPTHALIEADMRRLKKKRPPKRLTDVHIAHECVAIAFAAYRRWLTSSSTEVGEILDVETETIRAEALWAGRRDAVMRLSGGVRLRDWKTSSDPALFARMIPKYKLKLAAHTILYDLDHPDEPVHDASLVYLSTVDARFREVVVGAAELAALRLVYPMYVMAFYARCGAAWSTGSDTLHGYAIEPMAKAGGTVTL